MFKRSELAVLGVDVLNVPSLAPYLKMLLLSSLCLFSLYGAAASSAAESEDVDQLSDTAISTVVANELHFPKAILQLPNSSWLVAERDGTIVTVPAIVAALARREVSENGQKNRNQIRTQTRQTLVLPQLYQKGQGGLLHMALSPDFATSKVILLSYSKGTDEANRLAVMQGIYTNDGQIIDVKPVFEVKDSKATPVHFGGKLVAMDDGSWLVTTGDGFDYREQAQVSTSQLGKVLRFTLDGKPVEKRPFSEASFVYTYGHRNPQGLVKMPSGDIYLHEHGPDGGDELNRLEPGMNYGWPVVTLGKDYSGATISPFDHYEGMVDPLVDWTPSIAPSSMAVYNNNAFPTLTGQLLVTALKAKALYAVNLSTQPFQSRKVFPSINQRLRDVAVSNEGSIYLLTDGESAQLLQLLPETFAPHDLE